MAYKPTGHQTGNKFIGSETTVVKERVECFAFFLLKKKKNVLLKSGKTFAADITERSKTFTKPTGELTATAIMESSGFHSAFW